MISVLYFHGFASSPHSQKVQLLRALLEPKGVELNTPDLNVPSFEHLDFEAMVARGVEAGHRLPPRAVVGSSLGSLVALSVVQRGIIAPLVLIAPALGVADRWKERIPPGDPVMVFNHARNAEAPIHRAFFEQMFNVRVDDVPPPTAVVALMGTKDESVPFAMVEERWRSWEWMGLAPGSRFVAIEGGDHGLTAHAEVIADVILKVSEANRKDL